jgi:6-phosphogluconate dehydrogenase (decarboxylating)
VQDSGEGRWTVEAAMEVAMEPPTGFDPSGALR